MLVVIGRGCRGEGRREAVEAWRRQITYNRDRREGLGVGIGVVGCGGGRGRSFVG